MFKRLSSFLATVEGTKAKQKNWAKKFYEQLFEGYFIPGGRVLAGAGDLYRLKTLANCFVTKIERDDINSIYKGCIRMCKDIFLWWWHWCGYFFSATKRFPLFHNAGGFFNWCCLFYGTLFPYHWSYWPEWS